MTIAGVNSPCTCCGIVSFTCPCCKKISHNPGDAENGYCAACHWWTGDPVLGPPHLERPCRQRDLAKRFTSGTG
jgi:hypothetical protein